MVSICCPSRANSQNHLSDSRDLLQEEGGSSQHNGNITALTRPTPRIINLLKGTEWLSHTLQLWAHPGQPISQGGGHLNFYFFPAGQSSPASGKSLWSSCPAVPPQHPRNTRDSCRGASLAASVTPLGREEGEKNSQKAENNFPERFKVLWSLSLCSKASRQSREAGLCQRLLLQGCSARLSDYFCSELKPKHLQNSWQSCSFKNLHTGSISFSVRFAYFFYKQNKKRF